MITETRNRHSDPTKLEEVFTVSTSATKSPRRKIQPMVIGQGVAWAPAVRQGAQNFFSLPEEWLQGYVSGELNPAGGL
jgi:hypothetical protein